MESSGSVSNKGRDLPPVPTSECGCIQKSTLFKISLLIGMVIITLGAIALMSTQVSPEMTTPFLEGVKQFTTKAAFRLGTESVPLALFVLSVGGAGAFVGLFGWTCENCKRDHWETGVNHG